MGLEDGPGGKDQTREIKPYGQTGGINREAKRERTKRKELNGKNRNWRPKQSGSVGAGAESGSVKR